MRENKIIRNLIKVIIREGVIYPAPSNLNTLWVTCIVYRCLFQHIKFICESSTSIKRCILCFLLGVLVLKYVLFIKSPAWLFSAWFILLEFTLVGFISLVYLKRVAVHWVSAVAFIYMPACFLKWEAVQFSWLWCEDVIPFAWFPISFSGCSFCIFLSEFGVDLGFYNPGCGDVYACPYSELKKHKDKMLLSLALILSLVLRLTAYWDYPWVFSGYAPYVWIEIGGVSLFFLTICPIFGLVLLFFLALLIGAIISKPTFIVLFILWRKVFFICLFVEIVIYLARAAINERGFITRLSVITHSIFILTVFMYGLNAECIIFSYGLWRFLLERREQALFLELDAWMRQVNGGDVVEEVSVAIPYLTLGGKKYPIYQDPTGLDFIRFSPDWSLLVVSDKMDIIKKTLVATAHFDLAQLQMCFINTLFSWHFWDLGEISINNLHLWTLVSFGFCLCILFVCKYVFNQASVFCELLMFISIFMLVDFELFLFWPEDLFRDLVLETTSFFLFIWVYLMLELIFIVIKWAYNKLKGFNFNYTHEYF